MKFQEKIFYSFAKLSLSPIRAGFADAIQYANEKKSVDYWLGYSNAISFIVLLLSLGFYYLMTKTIELEFVIRMYIIAAIVVLQIVVPVLFYSYFYFRAEKRTEEVNKSLPNALSLIGANLRAGLTPYQSVKAAAIDEFGALGEEFGYVTSISIGNASFADNLLGITKRVRSAALERTIRLFVSSISSGTRMATLLDELSADISERAALKNNLMTNITTNIMFIMFIIIIGTPMLLSISIYFVDTVIGIQEQNDFDTTNSVAGFGGEIKITPEFLTNVSYVMLFLTGLFASFFVGGIIDGDIRKGLKTAPLIIIASYVVFFIGRFLISVMLG